MLINFSFTSDVFLLHVVGHLPICLSVNFLRFWLLFKNHLTYFNQTELKASLVKENSGFFSNEGPHPFPRGDKYMILNGLTFNIEFISQVRRDFWYLQDWNKFNIQCPIVRYSLVFLAYFFQFLGHCMQYMSDLTSQKLVFITLWK